MLVHILIFLVASIDFHTLFVDDTCRNTVICDVVVGHFVMPSDVPYVINSICCEHSRFTELMCNFLFTYFLCHFVLAL